MTKAIFPSVVKDVEDIRGSDGAWSLLGLRNYSNPAGKNGGIYNESDRVQANVNLAFV